MSRSVKMDYDRYRHPERRVTTLYKCYECATLTPTPGPDGVPLCDKHQDGTK